MKKINTITRKATLISGILMGAFLFTSAAVNADPTSKTKEEKKEIKTEAATIETEVMEYLENEDNLIATFKALNIPTIKIFDNKDNLIFTGKVTDLGNIQDKKILSMIHKSDFLMNLENTAYYKLQK